jgi:hypothetical protein
LYCYRHGNAAWFRRWIVSEPALALNVVEASTFYPPPAPSFELARIGGSVRVPSSFQRGQSQRFHRTRDSHGIDHQATTFAHRKLTFLAAFPIYGGLRFTSYRSGARRTPPRLMFQCRGS